MKISKSLKHSVLGICCSLGLSGFAYSQDPLDPLDPLDPNGDFTGLPGVQDPGLDQGVILQQGGNLEFAPTISIDDESNVSIVANNDRPMSVDIVNFRGNIRYFIRVSGAGSSALESADDANAGDTPESVYFVEGVFFDPITGEQINNLSITTGRGDDTININREGIDIIPVTGGLTIDTRNGDDSVFVEGVDVGGRTSIRGRAGSDLIVVHQISADSLYVGGGPGGDQLTISRNVVINRVSLSGGRDFDLLFTYSNDFREEPKVVNFELAIRP